MSDYYSQNDRHARNNTTDYYDNVGNGGAGWLWAGIALFAVVALIAAIFSGGGGEGTTGGEAAAPAGAEEQLITPAPADPAPVVTE